MNRAFLHGVRDMTASSDLGSGARRGAVSDVEQGNDQDENLRTTRQRITHQENKIKSLRQ
jgi:hypothetical protein